MSYNYYRKRHYNLSKTKQRNYANQMDELYSAFNQLEDWSLSSHMDSAYKYFDKYKVRLSNHSADNQYHDLHDGQLIINIKSSKLNFLYIIENKLEEILNVIDSLDLEKYRFINVCNGKINCYLKNFKTKKESYTY